MKSADTKSIRPPAAFGVPLLAAICYFSEGFPYGFVTELMPLYLRDIHVSLHAIGLASSISMAWTFKVLWAPVVDVAGSYRRWIQGALLVITGSLLMIALVPGASPLLWVALVLLTLASATQDIAADALTIRATPPSLVGPVNSIRVAAYRAAMILAGAGLPALAYNGNWTKSFVAATLLSGALLVFSFALPSSTDRGAVEGSSFVEDLRRWARREEPLLLASFILLYRIGDAALAPMIKPFWIDRGFTPREIGFVTTMLGISLLIAGAAIGGAIVKRYGIYSALLWLGILQMLSNAGYAIAASTGGGRPVMYAASAIENFTGGLGTAAFLSLLMIVCDRGRAATEYAMLTALYVLSRSLAGVVSGFAAESLGYAGYFWLTFFLGAPGLALLAYRRRWSAILSTAQAS